VSAPAAEGLGELLARVKNDATGYAKAELKLVQARAGAKVRAVQGAAIMGVVAALLAFATLIALMVGLILVIAGMPGSGWGTLAVVLGGFLICAILGWLSASGFKRGLKAGGGQ
jgi:hypothetical protein